MKLLRSARRCTRLLAIHRSCGWSQGKLENVQSIGLIFGVVQDCDYPVCEISITSGGRFLLYTDGLIGPENTNGESFGGRRLGEVVCESQLLPLLKSPTDCFPNYGAGSLYPQPSKTI